MPIAVCDNILSYSDKRLVDKMNSASRTPSAYALNLLEDASQKGYDLLQGLNISRDELHALESMSFEDFHDIVTAYQAWTSNRNWGFHLGKKLGISAHGALGVCALSASTIGEGLQTLCQFIASRSCSISAASSWHDQSMRAEFLHTGPMRRYLRPMTENLATVISNYLVTSAGHDNLALSWTFPYTKPISIALYQELLPGRFDFNGDLLAVTLPLELANAPSLLKNRSLHLSTRRQCEQALNEVRQNPDFSYITSILTSALVDRIGEAEPETKIPTITDLAQLLNRSERTLIRQLKANNTSFRHIKDEMLREYASDLLIKGAHSIADIAVKLGYENPGNFTRACKRLLGETPLNVRKAVGLTEN